MAKRVNFITAIVSSRWRWQSLCLVGARL